MHGRSLSHAGILTDSDYSAVVWALLLTCLVSPFVFRYVLQLDSESCDGRTADGDKNTFDDFSNGDRRDVNQRPGSSSAPCVNHVEMKRGQRHAIATGKAGVDGDGDTFEADLARSGIKITLE